MLSYTAIPDVWHDRGAKRWRDGALHDEPPVQQYVLQNQQMNKVAYRHKLWLISTNVNIFSYKLSSQFVYFYMQNGLDIGKLLWQPGPHLTLSTTVSGSAAALPM